LGVGLEDDGHGIDVGGCLVEVEDFKRVFTFTVVVATVGVKTG